MLFNFINRLFIAARHHAEVRYIEKVQGGWKHDVWQVEQYIDHEIDQGNRAAPKPSRLGLHLIVMGLHIEYFYRLTLFVVTGKEPHPGFFTDRD